MHKSLFDIARLLYKHKTETLTDEAEAEQLRQWLCASHPNQELSDRVASSESFAGFSEQIAKIDVDEAWRLFRRAQRKRQRRNLRTAYLKYAAAIAVVIGLAAGGYWWRLSRNPLHNLPQKEAEARRPDIVPGTTRATLTLQSGEQIELEEATVLSAEQVAEYARRHTGYAGAGAETFSTIETPAGGEYRLTLSDGTAVCLNSLTILRFPDKFADGKREIELLAGEIYLDVRPSAESPFFVKTKGMAIRVIGTSFNLSIYDNVYQTTLVKGLVEVRLDTGESYKLAPSEQLSFPAASGSARIRRVDTDLYTSWIDGRFVFRDETIEEIMKSLSRWYNFDFVFDSLDLKAYRFGVHINKYDSINPFLHVLESTGKLQFEVDGNVIRIKKGGNR